MVHMAFFLRKADIMTRLRECALTIKAAKSQYACAIRAPLIAAMGIGVWAFAMRTGPLHEPAAKQDRRNSETPLKTKPSAHCTRPVSNAGLIELSTNPHAGGPV